MRARAGRVPQPRGLRGYGHLTGVVYTMGGTDARGESAEANLAATPSGGDTNQTFAVETTDDGSFRLELPAEIYELTAARIPRVPAGSRDVRSGQVAQSTATRRFV